jgi:hypothetical protein
MGKLVWLASYPKSGNTWLRAFLHNYIVQPDAPYSINALADFSAVECAAALFRPHTSKPVASVNPDEVQALRPAVHRDLTQLHADLVFVKTHNANLALHGTAFCTPSLTAGAIYIVRDPRDVALSYAAYTGISVDETIAFMGQKGAANLGTDIQVFELLSSWSVHVESWTQAQNFLVLRYEDMIASPQTAFARVVRYLGDGDHPARLAKSIAFSRFDVLAAQEQRDGYAAHAPGARARFFRQGRAAAWRSILTSTQLARIESDHGAIMRRFSYLTL